MNIKELKAKIKDLPDEMKIRNTGHFGEYLECDDVYVRETRDTQEKILVICIEDAGPEPE